MARGVEHHRDHTIDVTVWGFQRADVHAETPGHGRSDLFSIQLLAFDLAALQNVRRQGSEDGFLL